MNPRRWAALIQTFPHRSARRRRSQPDRTLSRARRLAIEPLEGRRMLSAADDSYATRFDQLLSVAAPGVLANDTDVALLDFFDPQSQRGAAVTWQADGSFTYDPRGVTEFQALQPGESLEDTFTYLTYLTGSEEESVATVTVTVSRPAVTTTNRPPTAIYDTLTHEQHEAAIVAAPGLLSNDVDPDAGDALTVVRYDAASTLGATVVVNPDGSYSYTPNMLMSLLPGQRAADSFTYTIRDAGGLESTGTVFVDYTESIAIQHLFYGTDAVTPLEVDAASGLAGHRDPAQGVVEVTFVGADATTALGGALSTNPDGSFRYDPTGVAAFRDLKVGEYVEDSFRYTVTDGTRTGTATAAILVYGTPDDGEDYYDATAQFPTTFAPGVLANDAGSGLTVTDFDHVSQQGAAIAIEPDGRLVYDPTYSALNQLLGEGDTRLDQFTYTTTDVGGATRTILVSVVVAGFDHPVTPLSDSYQAHNLAALRVSAANGLLANDYDQDELGETTAPTMTVRSAPMNRPGDGNRDGVFDSTDLVDALAAGKYEVVGGSPATWEEGDWNHDGVFDSDDLILAMSIGGYEDPGAATPDLGTFDLSGDGKVDDMDRMLASQGVQSLHGAKVTIHADGSFEYDPRTSPMLAALGEGESVIDEFVYTVTDSSGLERQAFVQIDLRGRDEAPEAKADAYETTDGESLGLQFNFNVLANDVSHAADPLLAIDRYQATSRLGATVFIDQGGTLNYNSTGAPQIAALQPGESLIDDFTYTVIDANGRESTATVSMKVFGVSEAPDDIFFAPSTAVKEVAAAGVLANDPAYLANPSTTTVTAFDATSALGATVTVWPDGSFTYDPRGVAAITGLAAGAVLYDSFTYSTQAGGGVRQRVNVVVSPETPATVGTTAPSSGASVTPIDRELRTLLAENPEYGARNIAQFYEGLPVNINSNVTAPTSQIQLEIVDFRGTPMLRIYLLPALGGDNALWRLQDGKLTELIYVRNGLDTAVQYTANHVLPDPSGYQSVWITGFDRAPNRYIDVQGTKPVVVSGGIQKDVIELKNLTALTTLPGEEFYSRTETGEGDDFVLASGARDKIDLGPGADTTYANGGDDLIYGGPGKDLIDGNDGRNVIDPGPAGEGDVISNGINTLPAPSLDVIQRKLKPEELAKTKTTDAVFFEDGPPAGASFVQAWRDFRTPVEVLQGAGPVQSGGKSFTTGNGGNGFLFQGASSKLKINAGDTLYAWVYLDPAAPPAKIALNYRVGPKWDNGGYWGQEPMLQPGQVLRRGETLWSADGSLGLVLQGDGNLVLYNVAQGGVLWASNTVNSGADRLVMQTDGNLVLYAGGQVKWASNTAGNLNASLQLQTDGNLVINGFDGSVKWAAGSNRGVEILKTTRLGELPETGKWEKLEFTPASVGLKPGDEIDGMFFRAVGGKAYFDHAGVEQVQDKDAPTMSVRLTSDILSIVGSENYGFQVQANWNVTTVGGVETFTAVGPMTLKSKIGDIPFVSPPVSIVTTADGEANFGIVATPSISFAGMTLRTAALGALNDVLDNVGLNLQLSGMQFGVALGKTLTGNLLKQVGAPLVDSIPYIYFSSFNAPSISFGEIGVGVDNTAGLAVIFDPADPFIYVQGQDPRGDIIAVGVSNNGYIPYSPTRELDARMGADIFGNVYARAKILIPVKAVDVGIEGEITVDTDLNDDGNNFYNEFDPQFFSQLISGQRGAAADKFVAALGDLGVGVNGKLSVGFGKKGIGIELPVGSAAAEFKGNKLAFNGGSVNPFAGTFLEKFNTTGEVQIDGYVDSDAFAVNARMASAKYGAVQFAGNIQITHRDITAAFTATSPIPTFPQLDIRGRIQFNGDFYLTGVASKGLNFGPFNAGMSFAVAMGRDPQRSFYMNAQFKSRAELNLVICEPFSVGFDVGGGVVVADAFLFNLQGSAGVSCKTPWWNPVPSINVGVGFGISNSGFEIKMPGPIPNVKVNF